MEDREGGRQAVRYLIDRGYRNIGGIFKSDDMQGAERYAGYSRALTDADLPIHDEAVVWYTTESRQMILEQTKEIIMERLCGCDAVLCYNDEVAACLLYTSDPLITFFCPFLSSVFPASATHDTYCRRKINSFQSFCMWYTVSC